jgi:hypothetical protein
MEFFKQLGKKPSRLGSFGKNHEEEDQTHGSFGKN